MRNTEVARYAEAAAYLAKHPDDETAPKKAARGAGKRFWKKLQPEGFTADRGTGGFEEAAGHSLLGTESHPGTEEKAKRQPKNSLSKGVLQDRS